MAAKTNQRRQKKTVYKIKYGAQKAAMGFSVSLFILLIFLLGSMLFILYQWKDYQLATLGKQIDQLQMEILQLNSENSRLQATLNSLTRYNRIYTLASNKVGLRESIEQPHVLIVDRDKLNRFREKDRQKDNGKK